MNFRDSLMEGHCKTTSECIKRRSLCPCYLQKYIKDLEVEIKKLEEAVFNDPDYKIGKDISGELLMNYVAGIINIVDNHKRGD